MYIWNHKKLARDLKKDIVTPKEQMSYLLISSAFSSIFMTVTVNAYLFADALPLTSYDYIIDIIFIIVTLLSVIISYKINDKGNGKNFVVRYVCVTLPIIIKTTLLLLILSIPALFIDLLITVASENIQLQEGSEISELFIEENARPGPTTVIFSLLVYFYMLRCYITSFKIASGQKEYGK